MRNPRRRSAPSECGSIFMFDSRAGDWSLTSVIMAASPGKRENCVCRLLLCYRNGAEGIERKFYLRWAAVVIGQIEETAKSRRRGDAKKNSVFLRDFATSRSLRNSRKSKCDR